MNTNRPPSSSRPWLPAAAAGVLIGAVVVAGIAGGWTDDDLAGPPPSTDARSGKRASPSAKPVATVAVETVPKEAKTKLAQPLSYGMYGDDVADVQRRLKRLRFDPGPVDGSFGVRTRAAVWGFEKLIMGVDAAEATGVVTKRLWSRMQDEIAIEPRRPDSTPNHTEIYLPEQIVIFFEANRPALISHMSSGNGEEWCDDVVISPGEYGNVEGTEPLERRECGRSVTPGGVYGYYRQVKGIRQSALGGMWNPVYFNYGIAIHGAIDVPLYPASHGCIRIPIETSEWFHRLLEMGDRVFVFDGVKEPEEYGDQPPVFNWIDPEWLATSTTSTTAPPTTQSPTSTTTTPPTTPPPATTAETSPPTTTTVAPPPPTRPPMTTTMLPPTTRPSTPPTTVAPTDAAQVPGTAGS